MVDATLAQAGCADGVDAMARSNFDAEYVSIISTRDVLAACGARDPKRSARHAP